MFKKFLFLVCITLGMNVFADAENNPVSQQQNEQRFIDKLDQAKFHHLP